MKQFAPILLFICASSFAQINLVPNGDFENHLNCPSNIGGNGDLNCAVPWYRTQCSPDYFNSCDTSSFPNLDVPSNAFGYQYAYSGSAYAGFYTYAILSPGNNNREYIEVMLNSNMITNHYYVVSFYVSLADNCEYASNTIGAFFSFSSITGNNCMRQNHIPQVQNDVSHNLTDTSSWMLVQDTMIAVGGEQYMTIGNFMDDTQSGVTFLGGSTGWNSAYYYIDDVSVIDLGPTGIKKNENIKVNIYPNPANTGITLQFEKTQGIFNITLGDVLGNIALKESSKGVSSFQLNTSQVPDGIYFLKGNAESGELLLNRKIIIQH